MLSTFCILFVNIDTKGNSRYEKFIPIFHTIKIKIARHNLFGFRMSSIYVSI